MPNAFNQAIKNSLRFTIIVHFFFFFSFYSDNTMKLLRHRMQMVGQGGIAEYLKLQSLHWSFVSRSARGESSKAERYNPLSRNTKGQAVFFFFFCKTFFPPFKSLLLGNFSFVIQILIHWWVLTRRVGVNEFVSGLSIFFNRETLN